MKKAAIIAAAAILAVGCSKEEPVCIIPQPQNIETREGSYDFTRIGAVVSENSEAASFISGQLSTFTGLKIGTEAAEGQDVISIDIKPDSTAEKYILEVGDNGISVTASDYPGAVHAMYTLMQLMPTELYSNWYGTKTTVQDITVRKCRIEDWPRFGYRGLHLDVSRHFFTKDEVKRYIDIIAMHKLNTLHWHLTDDTGWRLEIKKYPLLTSVSAWRAPRPADQWDTVTPQEEGEECTYGGFYTQDEAREVVAYAAERGVRVIPEIEIPGHSSEVFAAYPSLACFGKPQPLPTGGGSGYSKSPASVFCAGNEAVFSFLEDVLKEVVEVFPDAPYIHIGGDEASKEAWKHCRKCQKRIKDEGLANEDELQSYVIKRIEKIVNALGKPIIGWDEILEGGVAPNATIMSWRGTSGGIQAAKAGHDVIMTPGTHLYFDNYQDIPGNEPKAIGGFLTTKKVYSFEPIPEELTKEESLHILGAQANLWTEYIGTFDHVEYMALPRACALSEVDWSSKESRNWDCFSRRLSTHMARLRNIGFNCHHGATEVGIETELDGDSFLITMTSQIYGAEIRYTTDGSEPDSGSELYSKPVRAKSSIDLKAAVFMDGERLGKICTQRKIGFHKALGRKVTYNIPYSSEYVGSGETTLVDGLSGNDDIRSPYLQGFCEHDMDVVIDLEEETEVKSIEAAFIQSLGSWIYLPSKLSVYASSDGTSFTEAGSCSIESDPVKEPSCRKVFKIETDCKARYLRVVATNAVTPEGLPGAGKINWIFADEIFVE